MTPVFTPVQLRSAATGSISDTEIYGLFFSSWDNSVTDGNDFLIYVIEKSGYFYIYEFNGSYKYLDGGYSFLLTRNTAPNTIAVEKEGDNFRFYIDNIEVKRLQIEGYDGGGAGIITSDSLGIAYDNFKVTSPLQPTCAAGEFPLMGVKDHNEFVYKLMKSVYLWHNEVPVLDYTSYTTPEALLDKNELDLCLAFGRIPAHFHKLLIREVRMPLMIPATLMNTPADLSQACWIINAADCPFKEPLEKFWRTHGMQPRSTILAQDLSRRELVAQGFGIGFLEPQDGLALIRKGQARWHGQFYLEVPLWVVYRDPTLQADAEHLQRYVQQRYEALPPFTGGNCAD